MRRRIDTIIAVLLFAGTVSWMLAVEGQQGIGRDEAQYFRAAERYWGWFEELGTNLQAGHPRRSFTVSGLDRYWGDNHEHPPVMKVLYALSWRAFHRCQCVAERGLHFIPITGKHATLPLFKRDITAFRFPAILFAGLMAAIIFLFGRHWVGRGAAAAGAVMAIAQPHYFFHAQISCFDAPITTMAVVVGFAYWKSLRSARWGLLCGVLFGVALATKHNAWLMPIFLLGHYLWMRRGDLRKLRLPRVPLAFVSMATIGPLVFLMLWPWLWPAPVQRARDYVQRHLQHEHYHFEFLGINFGGPPKDTDLKLLRVTFPFVSTGLTVPATTLVLAVAGGLCLARRRRRNETRDDRDERDDVFSLDVPPPDTKPSWSRPGADVDRAPGAFLAAQVFGPMLVLAVPAAPVFGGIKHFMTAMPFLALSAAVGVRWLVALLLPIFARQKFQRAALVGLPVLLVLPALVETRRSHPDGLSHYNFFAGGFAGGASLGMNRQFWGYSVQPALGWMTAHQVQSHRTYWHDVFGDALTMYVRDGFMPPGLGNTGVGEEAITNSDLGILIHERHMTVYEGVFWESYGTTRPAYVRDREGVPIMTIYRRPGAP